MGGSQSKRQAGRVSAAPPELRGSAPWVDRVPQGERHALGREEEGQEVKRPREGGKSSEDG